MSGHLVRSAEVPLSAGKEHVTIRLDDAAYARLAGGGSALISFETPQDEVQALDVALAER
jgi:hypothetical protein